MNNVDQNQITIFRWVIAISVVMLFLAMLSNLWPYGYYIFLRWVVAGTGAFAAYIAYNLEKTAWAVALGLVALLFNPIVPVHLAKDTWVVIDFLAAVFYLVMVFIIRLPKTNEPKDHTV